MLHIYSVFSNQRIRDTCPHNPMVKRNIIVANNLIIDLKFSTAFGGIYIRFFQIILFGAAPLSPSLELSSRISYPSLEPGIRLLLGEDKAEAEVVAAVVGRNAVAIRRAAAPRAVAPAPTT